LAPRSGLLWPIVQGTTRHMRLCAGARPNLSADQGATPQYAPVPSLAKYRARIRGAITRRGQCCSRSTVVMSLAAISDNVSRYEPTDQQLPARNKIIAFASFRAPEVERTGHNATLADANPGRTESDALYQEAALRLLRAHSTQLTKARRKNHAGDRQQLACPHPGAGRCRKAADACGVYTVPVAVIKLPHASPSLGALHFDRRN